MRMLETPRFPATREGMAGTFEVYEGKAGPRSPGPKAPDRKECP